MSVNYEGPMARITLEEVQAAYKQTGIHPIRRSYVTKDPGLLVCGCPMTALYLSTLIPQELGAVATLQAADVKRLVVDWANRKYGDSYHTGFTEAVDDMPNDHASQRDAGRYALGREDGMVIKEALFGGRGHWKTTP